MFPRSALCILKKCHDGSMKIQKTKTLLLSLLLTLSLNNAHAQNFGSLFGGIREKITEVGKAAVEGAKESARERVATDDIIVDNSLLEISGNVSPDVKWLMILIKKDEYKEQLILPINDGTYQTRISLQEGAGVYDIELYANTNVDRYTSYTQFKKFTVENTDSRDMSFLLPTFKVQVDDPRITFLVESVTKNARNDEEAFLAIYKYVTSTIKYDYAALNNNAYTRIDYNAVYTFVNSSAVCEGYANLIAAMSRAYGIRTKVVFGQAKGPNGYAPHAWNEVFINNEWKIVDATWDAILKHQPYLFIDADRFALDHAKEQEMKY